MIPVNSPYSVYDEEEDCSYRIERLDDAIKSIQVRFADLAKEVEELRDENKNLKDEHYKDDELRRMKQDLDNARADLVRGFPIFPHEAEIIDKFVFAHSTDPKHPIKNLSFYYTFKPTEIGVFGEITCAYCGETCCFQGP